MYFNFKLSFIAPNIPFETLNDDCIDRDELAVAELRQKLQILAVKADNSSNCIKFKQEYKADDKNFLNWNAR